MKPSPSSKAAAIFITALWLMTHVVVLACYAMGWVTIPHPEAGFVSLLIAFVLYWSEVAGDQPARSTPDFDREPM